MKKILVLSVLLLSGCARSNKPSQFPTRNEEAMRHEQEKANPKAQIIYEQKEINSEGMCPWAPHNYIAELRIEAHRRGLTWEIYCKGDLTAMGNPNSSPQRFTAWAIHTEKMESTYCQRIYADWSGYGDTQQEAAKDLLEKIKYFSAYKPEKEEKCPPKLSGN